MSHSLPMLNTKFLHYSCCKLITGVLSCLLLMVISHSFSWKLSYWWLSILLRLIFM
uniref:Uncharacterized protein n=1 Tax=Arundo donax TaxID=35708 RepID=A0A0A9HNU1_ARUDO